MDIDRAVALCVANGFWRLPIWLGAYQCDSAPASFHHGYDALSRFGRTAAPFPPPIRERQERQKPKSGGSLKIRLRAYSQLTHTLGVGFAAAVLCAAAAAAELSLTGFGTIGYAVSDQRFQYLRYIDKGGALKTDSLVGLQGELVVDPQWSATAQVVASAPRTRDDGYEAQVRWAFVSYRPNNEWLFRAGRLRPPVLVNAQNAEVGVTFDHARLPTEVYSLVPVYDLDGAAITKTWALENSEINLDGYAGNTKIKFRNPFQANPALRLFPDPYIPEKVAFAGLVLSHSSGPLSLRAGAHRGTLRPDGVPFIDGITPVPVPAPPPFGGSLYRPGNLIDKLGFNAFTLGADWQSGDWRITGEYGRRRISGSNIGNNSQSMYATAARNAGQWTPYITYARLLSTPAVRKLYQDLNTTPVPLGAQGPPLFVPAGFHQILAGQIWVYDQYSTMLGASYRIGPASKLKFEWMRTHIGLGSALVDGDVHRKSFNVFSVSYNFVF